MLRLTDDALVPLEGYAWPGNVRELHNTMERAAVLCTGARSRRAAGSPCSPARSSTTREMPRAMIRSELRLEPAVAALERRIVLRALQTSGDNKIEAARLLGVSERTLWYKLKKYRL